MSTAALVCKSAQLYQGILAYFELRKLSKKQRRDKKKAKQKRDRIL